MPPHPHIKPVGFSDPLMWQIYVRDFWERADCLNNCTEMQQLIVESALARRDKLSAMTHLDDWGLLRRQHIRISKFEPGDHYYILDTKFDSYEEAVRYAKEEGYFSNSLHKTVVASVIRTGD